MGWTEVLSIFAGQTSILIKRPAGPISPVRAALLPKASISVYSALFVSEFLKKIPSRPPGWAFTAVALAAFALVLSTYVAGWSPKYGITRFINIGEVFNQRGIAAYRATPKYVGSPWGFDGQHYAEIALDPLLRDPQIRTAIDNTPYRARRILLPWLAWAGGMGRPFWVLNIYAALNPIFWLGYAAILIALFRPQGWAGLAGLAAMLMTCGVMESMMNSLTDFPSFVVMMLAMVVGGLGGAGWMTVSALIRPENSLLALPALFEYDPPWGRALARNVLMGVIAVAPLALWMAYLLWRLRGMSLTVAGEHNLDWPMHAIYLKSVDIRLMMREGRIHWSKVFFSLYKSYDMNALLTVVSTMTQCLYVLTHRDWRNRLWRMGALFVPFFICLGYQIWFSHFTVTRHALPITLAFNLILAMRPRRTWALWFLMGNCFVPFGIYDFYRSGHLAYPREEFATAGGGEAREPVGALFGKGWSNPEWDSRDTWRWAVDQQTSITLTNPGPLALKVELDFVSQSLVPRDLRVVVRGSAVWLGRLEHKNQAVATLPFSVPPGETTVNFVTSQPAVAATMTDLRELAFMVAEPRVTVIEPAAGSSESPTGRK
jgi:hypothetical protein